MRQRHYDVLGVSSSATPAEIRSAFRRLALKHHPDRSQAADAADRFSRIAEAYRVLSDPALRREYDMLLQLAQERDARVAARAAAASMPTTRKPSAATEMARLGALFSRGKYQEAERLAQQLVERFPREAAPYAILGDIARARGELNHAANMYAHAVQMEPRNALFQQRYEELMARAAPGAPVRHASRASTGGTVVAFAAAAGGALYLAVANEKPLFPGVAGFGSFTLGSLVVLFLVGVAVGTSLVLGGLLDRLSSLSFSSQGQLSPIVALGTVALVSFWAAVALYAAVAYSQRASVVSLTRLIAATVGALLVLALGALASPALHAGQVFLWGGNLVYVGSVCGWLAADALRRY